ncbi:MAG: nuclear transport factor 2 family protein [Alcanivorax sp.]|uniref:nuclear transport factor 2 family protein n=1 Tax=Alcanivorax sp. TaxID=1872427 RepID=UPI003DA76BCE
MTNAMTPTQTVQKLLEDPANPEHVHQYLSDDFVYVSLNYKNENLKKVMPWAGTHQGPSGFTDTFKGVEEHWIRDEFTPQAAFDDGENVAIFGSFTLRSRTQDKACQSPFAIFAKVNSNGKVTYFQYMEDTFGTADTFRTGGEWVLQTLPDKKVTV